MHEALLAERVRGGCTATVLLCVGDAGYVAHVGDTRAALVRAGRLARLTADHRPADRAEARAVRARGGFVLAYSGGGGLRVNGIIAVTRALGDRELAAVLSCDPDVAPVPLPLAPGDTLLLACDGLWDYVPFVSPLPFPLSPFSCFLGSFTLGVGVHAETTSWQLWCGAAWGPWRRPWHCATPRTAAAAPTTSP